MKDVTDPSVFYRLVDRFFRKSLKGRIMWSIKCMLSIVLFISMMMVQPGSAGFTVDHMYTQTSNIPHQWITAAKSGLCIVYNHTSHGSQLVTGMNALEDFPEFNKAYDWQDREIPDASVLCLRDRGIPGKPDLSQGDVDTDSDGIADWAEDTYEYLILKDAEGAYVHEHINVVIWSWCNIAGHDIDMYLDSMEWLITRFGEGGINERAVEFPVRFVFMTAHANGGGEYDSSDFPNRQIRQHCRAYNRILFDFSDIENYDPDGNYYLDKLLNDTLDYDSDGDGYRDANWASEYLDRHPGSLLDLLTHGDGRSGYYGCGSCAHSNGGDTDARLNCVLKGGAVWSLFAGLAGWMECTRPPTGLVMETDDSSPGSVEVVLSWKDNSAREDWYEIQKRLTGDEHWTIVNTLPAGATSYTDTADAAGTYEYRVSAHKETGDNAPCDSMSAVGTVLVALPDCRVDADTDGDVDGLDLSESARKFQSACLDDMAGLFGK